MKDAICVPPTPESIEVLKIHITQAAQHESKGMLSIFLLITELAACTERSTQRAPLKELFHITISNKTRAMNCFFIK
jgi:hypothetical protein